MTIREKDGEDIWDRIKRKMVPVVGAAEKRPWYQHRNAPKPGENLQRSTTPRPKPRTAPPMPPNQGGQSWWQDRRIPKQVQDATDRRGPRRK